MCIVHAFLILNFIFVVRWNYYGFTYSTSAMAKALPVSTISKSEEVAEVPVDSLVEGATPTIEFPASKVAIPDDLDWVVCILFTHSLYLTVILFNTETYELWHWILTYINIM